MLRASVSFVLLGIVLFSGCAPASGTRRAVQGTVKFQGALLDQGTITFLNETGPATPVAGAMIQNGRFEIPALQGLDPGKYRISIRSPEPSPPITPAEYAAGKMPLEAKERIPASFNTDSKEIVEVQASGSNAFDFDVK